MRQGSFAAHHRPGQRSVQRQLHPVTDDRLVGGGVTVGEREPGRIVEHLADVQVLKPGTVPHRG